MTPEERQLLIQTHRMVEENNAMLRKMRRAALVGRIFHLLYWIVIIGLSVGAFYFIQPYVEQIQGIYGGIRGSTENTQSTTNELGVIGRLLQGFGN